VERFVSAKYTGHENGLDQCDKHHQDLYFGDDVKPGITTRILIMEDTLKTLKSYARWGVIFIAGILLTAILRLVIKT
jgi:hypothetical protein